MFDGNCNVRKIHEFFTALSKDLNGLDNWFLLDYETRLYYLNLYCDIDTDVFVTAFIKNIYIKEFISSLVSFSDNSFGINIEIAENLIKDTFNIFDNYIGKIINENMVYISNYHLEYEESELKIERLVNELGSFI